MLIVCYEVVRMLVSTEWSLVMQCIGKIGTVHRITERGDIRVQYDGANNRWTFHAGSLTKVSMLLLAVILFLCAIS